MRTLRFPRAVYAGTAIDESVKVFGRWATFELAEEADHWVVQLTALVPANERRIAGEVGNYALGLTIQKRPAAAATPGVATPAAGAAPEQR